MEKKKKNIPDYRPGESVNDVFVVRFKKPVRMAKTGKYFFELKLQDAGGDIMFKFWGTKNLETLKKIYDPVRPDDVIKITNGKVGIYNENIDISVSEDEGTIKIVDKGNFDPREFVAVSSKNPEHMFDEVKEMLDSVKNPELKDVIGSFLCDMEFVDKFKSSPAAMYKHHGWIHGLLEHTLTVMKICNDISQHHTNLDRDLLITGAFLHDIGKIEEFETTTQIKVTDTGNLLGHISLGIQMLTRKLDKLDISKNTKQKLLHMIVSHHGKQEYGSPKTPGFPEALLLHKADELDAFITLMNNQKESAETEDSFIYTKDFGNIYLK